MKEEANLRSALGLLPVAAHHRVAPQAQLAALSTRHHAAVHVHQLRLQMLQLTPDARGSHLRFGQNIKHKE